MSARDVGDDLLRLQFDLANSLLHHIANRNDADEFAVVHSPIEWADQRRAIAGGIDRTELETDGFAQRILPKSAAA